MTVAEFVYSLSDGGAETLIKRYCSHIDRKRFKVVVVVIYDIGETAIKNELLKLHIPIEYVYNKRDFLHRGFNKVMGGLYVKERIKAIRNKYGICVIHAHTAVLRYLYRSRLVLEGVKLFYTCHSIPERYFSGKLKGEFKAARYLIKNNGMKLIALHDAMAEELNTLFSIKDTCVIYNGIDIDLFKANGVPQCTIRKQLNIPEDAYVIGHIGRFVKEKNHDLIVKVFRYLCQSEKDIFLLLIGDGELKEEISKELSMIDNSFLVLSHRNDIPSLLKAMDVFVFPSLFEGLGISFIEAQISGLYCVISENIPNEAIISNNVEILSVNADPSIWANAVLKKDCLHSKCLSINYQKFDMRIEIQKLEKLYLGKL